MLAPLLLSAWVAPADPQPWTSRSASIAWEAPAECPDEEQLLARIGRFAPGRLDEPDLSVRVEARIDAVEHGFEATIRVENEHGSSERRFSGPDCAIVSDASALVIAVALAPVESAATLREQRPAEEPKEGDPSAEHEPPPPQTDRPAELGPNREEPNPPSVNVSFEPPADSPAQLRARVGLQVLGGGAYGPTNAGFGVIGGALALFSGRWRVELTGSWSPKRVVRRGDVGGTFDAWSVGARGCFVPKRGRLEFPLCPGAELGQVRGQGLDELPVVQEASFLWGALGLGQGLWFVPHRRVALGLEARATVAPRGGAFVVDDREVQRLAPVSFRALAGVELRLP